MIEEEIATWSAAVRELRRRIGEARRGDRYPLPQEELAAEIGVRLWTVSRWETGATVPTGAGRRNLVKLCQRYDVAYPQE